LWASKFSSIYLNDFPSVVEKYQNTKSISALYDMTCLFAKGILLNADIEIRKLILESGNTALITEYNNLSSNISIYNKLIKTPIDKRFLDVDSLNNVIQRQEMKLAKELKAYGDYIHNMTIKWKDVQKGLSDNDIAIEFLDFSNNSDSIMYVALTLKKEYDCPHMVALFEEKQLKAISEDDYYTQTDLYDLIWKPLEEELRDVRNVYFAPSGELHRIGIEYLPVGNTKNISDVYTFHRLSSTRQLAVIQGKLEGKKSILYGGINYDEKTNVFATDSTAVKGDVLRFALSRADVDSLSLRSSFDYLEGTKRETEMIAEGMKQYSVPYIYYTGLDGTEESFKLLDGTKPKLMHIATHGFFLTEEEAKKSWLTSPSMLLMAENPLKASRPVEDKPMTRSGLLFSGCNHAIQHEQIPESEEDGILTAQEISTLDLRGLDLVVLSACQTGLGDVVSGEGVFGLQRGFKKAGAKTILMSLDKVDDEATGILMVEFYRNLMNGKTKLQSLKEAQQYLRKVDNGKYDNPKYWASFIMLDGLN
jgi:CHAT domain-containing protein